MKRGRVSMLPHANITVFQQPEPWKSRADEFGLCTWTAVENRTPLAARETAYPGTALLILLSVQ